MLYADNENIANVHVAIKSSEIKLTFRFFTFAFVFPLLFKQFNSARKTEYKI